MAYAAQSPAQDAHPPELRKATVADLPEMARVLARAFDADPFYVWLVRQDGPREARMRRTFENMARLLSVDLQETYTTSAVDAAAIWKPPGESRLSIWKQLALLPAFAQATGWTRLPRLLRMMEYMEALHNELVPQPHFYLSVLGVDPDSQRRGLGSLLLQPVLSRCDKTDTKAFLETSHPDNLPFYARHGFELVREVKRPDWPDFWLMVRNPLS
jgi:ribosomal protein S18 acetylase RimI-like enzyme